ncbi:MAG: glycosyltransferase family 1 protein [Opitutus sp.]|nr:glycosyltransferase family 1 protein [Opitutus sp.]
MNPPPMSVPPSNLISTARHPTYPTSLPSFRAAPAPRSPGSAPVPAENAPLIAFCHLGWDGVWQRPQQFLSRLAATHPVLFVECHCSPVAHSTLRGYTPAGHPNVTVLQMLLPAARWSDGAFIDAERRRLLETFRRGDLGRFDHPILWFNDPMAVTAFAGHCGERAIVYDCMDELAQFRGAPPQLAVRELELIRRADVVFCGGRRMREKRLPHNRNTHFYGTGVDLAHFGTARSSELPVDPQIAALPGKVLGYFGVIDERIDYLLLAQLAAALPECSIAMVGPHAKVDPADFPRAKNLHWIGRRDYADLPAITKGWAVCLMPFALNEATEYINPTKALEYMATGRPVVSTAINEVKSNFAGVSRVASSHAEFIRQCREECRRPSRLRIRRGLALCAQNTWDAIAARMDEHLIAAVHAREQNVETVVAQASAVGERRHHV